MIMYLIGKVHHKDTLYEHLPRSEINYFAHFRALKFSKSMKLEVYITFFLQNVLKYNNLIVIKIHLGQCIRKIFDKIVTSMCERIL